MIKYSITVFDAGPMSQSDKGAAVDAARKALEQYPAWLLHMAYQDYQAGLEDGVTHFETGKSLWAAIEAEAETAAWAAIGYQPVSGAHLEFDFWEAE